MQECFLVARIEMSPDETDFNETFPFYYDPLLKNFRTLYPKVDVSTERKELCLLTD